MPVALDELGKELGKKKVFIVTDEFLYKNGYVKTVEAKLDEMGITHTCFYEVAPDPTLECAMQGAEAMRSFEPDTIIALGGGSAMDAAKIMWVLYEHPEVDFLDMAMRFMDIRKRVYTFPKMGEKAYFVAIPTSSGTGSEVTPFAVITDEKTGVKYPLADYELLPNMAIIDADNMMSQPKGLTSASGIDALTHALERYAECARFVGVCGKDDKEIFEKFLMKIEELKEAVGIKKTIKDYGVDEQYFLDTLDEMVEQAFDDQCTGANPHYPLMKEIKEMYLKVYYGN